MIIYAFNALVLVVTITAAIVQILSMTIIPQSVMMGNKGEASTTFWYWWNATPLLLIVPEMMIVPLKKVLRKIFATKSFIFFRLYETVRCIWTKITY